jgi:hypothetical protein
MGDSFPNPPWLHERQRFVLGKLQTTDPRLHDWYLGALLALNDEANPDRVSLAGHGLREVSAELMKLGGVQESKFNLGNEITELLDPWAKVQEDAAACPGVCAKHVSGRFRKFLDRLTRVLTDQAQFHPKRQEQIRLAIKRHGVNSRIASGSEAENAQKRWRTIHDFFNHCGHHRVLDLNELKANLEAFELLLTDFWLPSPSGDLSAIDEILAEENANA